MRAKAFEIWNRIMEEATSSNAHGVTYDGEKIADIISTELANARESASTAFTHKPIPALMT